MVPLEQAGARRPPAVRRRINPAFEPLPASPPKPPLFKRRRFLIASSVVALAMGALIFMGVRSAAMYHMEVGELLAQGSAAYGEKVRLGGRVVEGSIQYEASGDEIRFSQSPSGGGQGNPAAGGYDRLRPDLQAVADLVPAGARVLDLGCGAADVTVRFGWAYPRVKIHGVDGAQAVGPGPDNLPGVLQGDAADGD